MQYIVFTDSSVRIITNSRPQRRCTANSQASLNVPFALPAKTRQRRPSGSVEDIYLNRLWRLQMPKEKPLESIRESPTSDQHGIKLTKRVRCLKFDDAPNKTKLRQRRQKAVKNGWKPLTKKHSALLDSQLACKLSKMDSDFLVEDLDNGNNLWLPIDKNTLHEQNPNVLLGVYPVTCAAAECVENVADQISVRIARDSCDSDGSVNLLQTEKILAESSDINKNTLNDILCERECRVKAELLKSNSAVCQEQGSCDLISSKSNNTVQCSVTESISPPIAECLPSSVKCLGYQQHKKVLLKKGKQSKTQSTKVGVSVIREKQNERQLCSESDRLSAVEEYNECAETAAVQLQGKENLL